MSYEIELSESELSEIKQKQRIEKSVKIFQRLQCILMTNQKIKKQDIADLLYVTTNTITTWIKTYKRGGLSLLTELHYEGRRKVQLDNYKEEIKQYVKNEVPTTISQIMKWLEDKHSFKTEHSWLYRYMKKNSIFLIKKLD